MKDIIILDNKDSSIRRIRDIIRYSNIKVENILECSGELEAYNEIKHSNVDLLIIGITNSNKDGIILAKKVKKLKLKTNIIAISERDNTSEIIELLRCGVREYFSSKFEDYELIAAIKSLEEEYKEEKNEICDKVPLLYEQLKYLLLQDDIDFNIANNLNSVLSKHIININYRIICTNYKMKNKINSDCLFFKNIRGHNIIMLKSRKTQNFIDKNLSGFGFGISKEYTDMKFIMSALIEGIQSREENFFMQLSKKEVSSTNISIEDNELERFIQLIGTSRLDINYNYIKRLVMLVKRCEISRQSFLELSNRIYNKINNTYSGVIKDEHIKVEEVENPFTYSNIDIYCEAIYKLILQVNNNLINKCDFYRNRIKIEEAVQYINKNYKNNINMTFISNYVSMNYTIFSLDFKEYTGKNFVNYLKEIRLKEAKRLLDETDMKINEISEAVGYDDDKHFMKTFKSLYSVTPSEYRKNVKAGKYNKNPLVNF